MLQVLLLFIFLHQSQGYGVKVQANVDIGDDELALVVQQLMQEYLQNGETEIDITELAKRIQTLTNPLSADLLPMLNYPLANDESKDQESKKDDNQNKEVKKTDKEIDPKAKHTKKEKSDIDELNDKSKEKEGKKSLKSNKKNKKRESDEFSDDKNERVGRKDQTSKKRHTKRVPDDFSDDSIEKGGWKLVNAEEETDVAMSKNHKIKSTKGHKHGRSNKNHKKSRKSREHNKTPKENEQAMDDKENINKDKRKAKKPTSQEVSSDELKEMRERIHIFGIHQEAKKSVTPSKYPVNNIRS